MTALKSPSSLKAAFAPRADAPPLPRHAWLWALLSAPAIALALWYPWALADVSDSVLGPAWIVSGLRWALVGLGCYVLVFRPLSWWDRIFVLALMWGVLGNYTQAYVKMHDGIPSTEATPYLLSGLCLHIAFFTHTLRLMFRPTPHEDRQGRLAWEKEQRG